MLTFTREVSVVLSAGSQWCPSGDPHKILARLLDASGGFRGASVGL